MTAAADKRCVLFITEDDPLYVIQFFDVFFSEYPRAELDIVCITVDRALHELLHKTAPRMLKFYGPVDFVRMGVRFANAKAQRRSIGGLAQEAGIAVVPCESVNEPEYIERARGLAPDVIVSVGAPEIFKKGILTVPRLGCINIHSGRLPVYRGMMPNFWQVRHGEDKAVITIHEMATQLDAGGVIATREFPVRERDTLDRAIRGTKEEGAGLMIEVLRKMRIGETTVRPLDMSEKKYFSFPRPEEVKAFRARGHRLL